MPSSLCFHYIFSVYQSEKYTSLKNHHHHDDIKENLNMIIFTILFKFK